MGILTFKQRGIDMQKSIKFRKPFYLIEGKKCSDYSYTNISELPFTGSKIVHQLLTEPHKAQALFKALDKLGLKIRGKK